MEKTLREVCTSIGVSRRAVQGYEKIGLVQASGHNRSGYLLYDDAAQKRIERIRLFQWFGFSLKAIQNMIDAPVDKQILLLRERKKALTVEQAELTDKLRRIEALIMDSEENQDTSRVF